MIEVRVVVCDGADLDAGGIDVQPGDGSSATIPAGREVDRVPVLLFGRDGLVAAEAEGALELGRRVGIDVYRRRERVLR